MLRQPRLLGMAQTALEVRLKELQLMARCGQQAVSSRLVRCSPVQTLVRQICGFLIPPVRFHLRMCARMPTCACSAGHGMCVQCRLWDVRAGYGMCVQCRLWDVRTGHGMCVQCRLWDVRAG